jgi:signal peptidase I
MTPYGHLQSLRSSDTLVSTLGGFLIPTVVLSMLATWLVDHGGPAPAVAYRGALLAFEWFSQVQPDLEWPILFLVGTIGPILGARFIRSIYLGTDEGAARWEDHQEDEPIEHHRLAATMTVMVALTVFLGATGLMGFRPGVVSGISMEPSIGRGDLVIIQQNVDPAALAVGDVVRFAGPAGHTIVHRIIAIDQTPTGRVFTTQGDNNRGPDPSFDASALRGKVVSSVPALGWPAIWVRGG